MKQRAALVALVGGLAVLAVAAVAAQAGLVCNVSPSAPAGCYWMRPRPIQRGAYVVACLPLEQGLRARRRDYLSRGPCPGGAQRILKVLAAMAGDRVVVGEAGVSINGQLWPHSAPLARDDQGSPMSSAPLRRRLGRDEVLLLSNAYAAGFDARYFGPLQRSSIVGTAVPWLTW